MDNCFLSHSGRMDVSLPHRRDKPLKRGLLSPPPPLKNSLKQRGAASLYNGENSFPYKKRPFSFLNKKGHIDRTFFRTLLKDSLPSSAHRTGISSPRAHLNGRRLSLPFSRQQNLARDIPLPSSSTRALPSPKARRKAFFFTLVVIPLFN